MELEYIPYWNYNVTPTTEQVIKHVQIIIWEKGICSIYFNEENILRIVIQTSDKSWDDDFFDKEISQIKLSQYGHLVNHIWLIGQHNFIIPDMLYEGEVSKLWFKKFYTLGSNYDIFDDYIASKKIWLIYDIDYKVATVLKKYYEYVPSKSLSGSTLNMPDENQGTVASMLLIHNIAIISVLDYNKLLVHQVFEFKDIEDIVFKIALWAEKYDFNPSYLSFHLSGIVDDLEEIALNLKEHFREVEVYSSNKGPVIAYIEKLIYAHY